MALEEKVRSELIEAFEAVAEAERAGGNISKLVEKLNKTIWLLEKEKLEEAESKIVEIISAVSKVKQEGITLTRNKQLQSTSILLLVAASTILVWFFGM